MKMLLSGQASKALIGAGTALTTWLSTYYGGTRWEPAVVAVIGAVLVYLVPNASKPQADGLGKGDPASRM
jgi:hypothetical protein